MSLTSYRAAPPRDQGFLRCQAFGCKARFIKLKRIDAVTQAICGQFQKFPAQPAFGPQSVPVRPRKTKIGWP